MARLLIASIVLIVFVTIAIKYFIQVIWAGHIALKIVETKCALLDSHAETMRLYSKFRKKWQRLDVTDEEIEKDYQISKKVEAEMESIKKQFKL